MAISPYHKSDILQTCNDILTNEAFVSSFEFTTFTNPYVGRSSTFYVFNIVKRFILSCKPDAANRVLEKLFQVPDFRPDPREIHEVSWLEVFWNSFPGRPDNTPWPQWDEKHLLEARRPVDPANVEFYGEWTDTAWIEEIVGISIGPDYDIHQWKGSQDVWTYALCTRVMCRPKDGKAPSRETLQEAFEAVEELSTMPLPPPHASIFPLRVYFILAVYLGYLQKARKILQEIGRVQVSDDYLRTPALYEVLVASMDDPPIQTYNDEAAKYIQEQLCAALTTRAEHGRTEPLQGVPMSELLCRFSEAAFFVYKQSYLKAGIAAPAQILRPPLTSEHVAKIEVALGAPLPPDLKEMALFADGFYGGWHFAGGGWGGVAALTPRDFVDYEMYLGIERPDYKKETRTREDGSIEEVLVEIKYPDLGNVYICEGAAYCDNYIYILCLPAAWKRIREAMGEEVEEGEYVLTYYTNWGGGEHIYPSMRAWLTGLIMGLESDVAAGYQEEESDQEEESGKDEEDEDGN